jgi:G:T-mismatch repair DNA endonuclease (very short patch repair protein)
MSNLDYWLPKLARNRRRDRPSRGALRKMGFAVWSFWEHELKGTRLAQTHRILERKLKARLDLHRNRQEGAHAEVPARRLRQG